MESRLLQVPKDLTWEIKRYEDHTRHLVNTDIDDLLDEGDSRLAAGKSESSQATDTTANGAAAATDAMDVEAKAKEDTAATEKVASKDACKGSYHALCLNFTLPAAAYATMCVREVTRQDTSSSFHTSLNGGPPAQRVKSRSTAIEAPGSVSQETSEIVKMEEEDDGTPTSEKQVEGEEETTASPKAKKGSAIKVGTSLQR